MTEQYYQDVRKLAWWIPGKKTRHAMRNVLYHIGNLENNSIQEQQTRVARILADMTLYKDKPKVFLLQTPEYGNIGDQAIALGTRIFLESYFKDKVVIEYSLNDIALCGDLIHKFISQQDIIFLQGGGNMGNLWMDIEEARRELLDQYPHNRIIVFPVSISFTEDENGYQEIENSKAHYNIHKNLTIMARDRKSYEIAKEHFIQNKITLIPDAACNLTKCNFDFTHLERSTDIMLAFRSDKEKILNDFVKLEINKYCKMQKLSYNEVDTCIDKHNINYVSRYFQVQQMLANFAAHKLCITDRFHGMLFSYITKTPCIVFPSLDHKIPYGYEWLKNIEWIYKVDNSETNIAPIIESLLQYKTCEDSVRLADIFYNNFTKLYTKEG